MLNNYQKWSDSGFFLGWWVGKRSGGKAPGGSGSLEWNWSDKAGAGR
jgi:hypothetical protein